MWKWIPLKDIVLYLDAIYYSQTVQYISESSHAFDLFKKAKRSTIIETLKNKKT